VAIHISNTPKEQRDAVLRELHDLYISAPGMSTWVDVHLILDDFDRQFNMWRNVARFFARTEFVIMLDVDFAVCTDFRRRVLRSPAIMDKLRHGDTALVIPAFEFVDQQDGRDADTFPTTKEVRVDS
jgi:Glycosyl-transferase for dystroglycan